MTNEVEVSISCEDCVRRGTPDCSDCLVSFVVGSTPDELTLSDRDAQVVALFTAEGMVPALRYRSRTP